MDWIITSLIDELKESGLLDKTLVVITADHGEMLGENGGPRRPRLGILRRNWRMCRLSSWTRPSRLSREPHHWLAGGFNADDSRFAWAFRCRPANYIRALRCILQSLNTNRTIYLNTARQYATLQGACFTQGDREIERVGGADSRTTFDISNEGSHTSFAPEELPATNAPNIFTFDKFQNNFLHNYFTARCCTRRNSPNSRRCEEDRVLRET